MQDIGAVGDMRSTMSLCCSTTHLHKSHTAIKRKVVVQGRILVFYLQKHFLLSAVLVDIKANVRLVEANLVPNV